VAAIAAVLAGLDVHPEAARLAFAAALVTGGSDTIASEIGKAFGRRTVFDHNVGARATGHIGRDVAGRNTRRDRGSDSAWRRPGLARRRALCRGCCTIVVGASVGSVLEAGLARRSKVRGILNNDVLNFINTAAGAFAALSLWSWPR